ncbi:MAG TPA: glycosyltransferase family 2 protein [Anaerolineae bacterium]|nr:glycosyltransferase family 2 protein [Anaerolineae bacterium]HIP72992.1 glycosyltransferase family 2 protein [Anaerolineae bacterium]
MKNLFSAITVFCLAMLAYHYLIYAALMKIWGVLRPRPVQQAAVTPTVSLIISAYNEANVIAQKAENSLALGYPADKLEIIFVTDGSDDDTPAIVRQYAENGIILLHDPVRRGKSAAMNRGAARATGDILVFSDANAFYEPDVLRKVARNFADETVGGVSGNKTLQHSDGRIGQSAGLYWRYESALKSWESAVGSTGAVVGEMMAVRRVCFTPIPPHIINDDTYLLLRLTGQGWRVLHDPEAICWETAVLTPEDERIRRRRITAGRYQLVFQPRLWPWRYPLHLFQFLSHKVLRSLLPFFMVGAFVANLLLVGLRQANKLMKLTFVGQLFVYLLALVGALFPGDGRVHKLPTIVYYIVNGNLTSLQGLARYLSGKQTVLWEKARREEE